MLRYLGAHGPASAAETETDTGMSARLIGKAIRRLVNFDLIELVDGIYRLTTDGKLSSRQLAEYDRMKALQTGEAQAVPAQTYHRRLAVVMPRTFAPDGATNLYIGVNPPNPGSPAMPSPVHVELRITALNGTTSSHSLSLHVPTDKAATPGQVGLLPAKPGLAVRVRIDAFQATDANQMDLEPLGGFFFDVKVAANPADQDTTMRAVGMDLFLKPGP